jgi:hypothetical protein
MVRIFLISLVLLILQVKGGAYLPILSQQQTDPTGNIKISQSSMIMMSTKRARGKKRMKGMKLPVK